MRVRLLRNSHNLGPAGTRNAGVRAATSEWIGFLDADDLWPPNSLATRLAAPAGEDDCVLGAFEELLVGDVKRPFVPLPLETGRNLGDGWVAWEAPHSAHGVIALWRIWEDCWRPRRLSRKSACSMKNCGTERIGCYWFG
ncbi:glycosyltransferase family 2 protein [Muricoccus aerilatus]|uniref:glycosyltransferase family 2 protein n=1 Tax=Muricoccus aerilatus TaxID=452982 RepID=UPI000A01EC6C